MGLGKTSVALTWLSDYAPLPALVLAPLRVARSVWPAECRKWKHLHSLSIVPALGSPIERLAALDRRADVTTINYDNLPWLLDHFDGHWPYRTVIADESTRLKSYRVTQGSVRARAIAKVAHKRVSHWVNLSGLAAPNGVRDLWGQQWFIDGGAALGRSFSAFEQRWFYSQPSRQGFTQSLPFAHAQAEIQALMKPTTLAIDAKDWFTLSEPIVTDVWVDLPAPAARKYREMERYLYTELERGVVNAANAGVKVGKLLQFANGAVYHEDHSWSHVHDEKIEALKSVIAEAAGAPVLVAYQYRSDLERLVAAFPKARVLDRNDKTIEQDWNSGGVDLMLAHPKSAGHGLNLQHGGNILVYFGQGWDLEDFEQILERIGPVRQMQAGLNRPVWVYHIKARGTQDVRAQAVRDGKMSVMDALTDAMKE